MTGRQQKILVTAILGSAIATIDGTVVNVTLPAIERDLGGGLSAHLHRRGRIGQLHGAVLT